MFDDDDGWMALIPFDQHHKNSREMILILSNSIILYYNHMQLWN